MVEHDPAASAVVATMNVWFGTNWGAPVCQETPRIDVPLGAICTWCEEPIAADDSGWGERAMGPFMHVECFGRMMFGSTGHQLKLCPCFGGDYEGEPPEMSRRDAARAAWAFARERAFPKN